MDKKPSKDLEVGALEEISWTPDDRGSSLEKVFKYVSGEAQRAIVWYLIHAAANLASFLAFRGLAINESIFWRMVWK